MPRELIDNAQGQTVRPSWWKDDCATHGRIVIADQIPTTGVFVMAGVIESADCGPWW